MDVTPIHETQTRAKGPDLKCYTHECTLAAVLIKSNCKYTAGK